MAVQRAGMAGVCAMMCWTGGFPVAVRKGWHKVAAFLRLKADSGQTKGRAGSGGPIESQPVLETGDWGPVCMTFGPNCGGPPLLPFFGWRCPSVRPSVARPSSSSIIRVPNGMGDDRMARKSNGGKWSSFWEGKVQFQSKFQGKHMRPYQLAHGGCACGLELRNFGR